MFIPEYSHVMTQTAVSGAMGPPCPGPDFLIICLTYNPPNNLVHLLLGQEFPSQARWRGSPAGQLDIYIYIYIYIYSIYSNYIHISTPTL